MHVFIAFPIYWQFVMNNISDNYHNVIHYNLISQFIQQHVVAPEGWRNAPYGFKWNCVLFLMNSCYNYIILLPLALFAKQIKATSSEWEQSSTPIVLAGQSMSLLSVPKQRRSSNHIRVDDEGWEKLYIYIGGGNDHD